MGATKNVLVFRHKHKRGGGVCFYTSTCAILGLYGLPTPFPLSFLGCAEYCCSPCKRPAEPHPTDNSHYFLHRPLPPVKN
jgi:hypothetical protein